MKDYKAPGDALKAWHDADELYRVTNVKQSPGPLGSTQYDIEYERVEQPAGEVRVITSSVCEKHGCAVTRNVCEAGVEAFSRARSEIRATDDLKSNPRMPVSLENGERASDSALTAPLTDPLASSKEQPDEVTALRAAKDGAYAERNKLVAALSKLFPAWLERHPDADTTWEDDWRWIVFINLPNGPGSGQVSWHIHDSELIQFDHLSRHSGNGWDGHTTEEKYLRLACLHPRATERESVGFNDVAVLLVKVAETKWSGPTQFAWAVYSDLTKHFEIRRKSSDE